MKSRARLLRIVIPVAIVAIDIKFLQHSFSLLPFLILALAIGYLVVIAVMGLTRKGKSTKYERKPQSPWGALNEGIDPSL
jgi:hypothetical protein